MISLVTAKDIRANAQHAYKMKGKGEKYLVCHEEGESATDIIVDYLTPYALEGTPIHIESVVVQKNSEILESEHEDCPIYKLSVRGVEDTDDGRVKKFLRRMFVQAISPDLALELAKNNIRGCVSEYEILSVQKTPIIEIKADRKK